MQERYHSQRVRRVGKKCKIGNELVLGGNLKVVTGFGLSVTHGILLHPHESSILVRLGIGVALLQRIQMIVVFLQLVPVRFQFFQLPAFLSLCGLLRFRGRLGNLFKRIAQFARHFSQHGRGKLNILIVFR